jgi:hypothetical protein
LKRRFYWDLNKDGDDFMKYPRIALEEMPDMRKEIFSALKKKLPEHLDYTSKDKNEHWFARASGAWQIKSLLDQYLELEQVRFMKQYGAGRVHPQLLDKFLTLTVNLHDFKIRPLVAILKEYSTIEKLNIEDYKQAVGLQESSEALSPQGNQDAR